MNKAKLGYLIALFSFLAITSFSCKLQEKENIKVKVKSRPTKFLVKQLIENEFEFTTISAKAAVTVEDGKKTSFKAHLRIQKDSVIWMSITPLLGIEVARVIITQDTVKLLNRAKSEYFIGDFDYINKLFGADLDYQMLEALLIGNSLDFEMDDKIRSSVDRRKNLYYLSTVKKRKIKKEIRKDKDKIKEQAQALWLDPETFKIKELLLSSIHNENTLTGKYSNYKAVNEELLPYTLNFTLQSKDSIMIEVDYTKFNEGKSLSFPFKIPSKYEQIKQ